MRTFSTSLLALATMLSVLTASAQPAPPKPTAAAAAAQPPKPTASAATPPPARPAPPQKAVLPRILSDAMVKVARDIYLQGAEAMAQGRTADARAAFSAALGLNPHYSIYCNLGDADLRLGRPTNAAEEFAECVPGLEKDAKVSDAERAAVKKLFADAKAKVVEVVTHSGRAAGMPQVTTSIDTDRSSNNDDVTAYLEPGKHVVRFEAEGYESIAVDFDGAAGTRKEITPAWKKKAGPVVPMPTATAEVPPAGPRKGLLIVGASAAGAAAITGGVLLGLGAAKKGDADTLQQQLVGSGNRKACAAPTTDPKCKAFTDAAGAAQGMTNTGAAVLIGAGALALGTVIYALVSKPDGQTSSVQAGFTMTSSGGGAVVRATW